MREEISHKVRQSRKLTLKADHNIVGEHEESPSYSAMKKRTN